MSRERRGPLAPLAGVPGVTGTLVRAGAAAVVQTAGLVLLAAGLAHAIARIAGQAAGSPTVPLVLAAAAPRFGFVDSGDGIARRIAHLLADQTLAAPPTGTVVFTAVPDLTPAFRDALAAYDLGDIRTL